MLLRPADPADAMAVARVHVRSWQVAYRNLLPQDYLDRLRPEDRAARYEFGSSDPSGPQTIVAIEDDTLCGFATTMPSRDSELTDHGELAALYVDPAFWNRRIGAALVDAARTQLFNHGYRRAMLWVLHGNARADRFYRLDGWKPDGVVRSDTVWGVAVNESRYRRELSA